MMLAARSLGVDAAEFGDSITPGQLDKLEAADRVVPMDHAEKMLGLIAMMLAGYLGMNEITSEMCCPWIDMSDEALMARATEDR